MACSILAALRYSVHCIGLSYNSSEKARQQLSNRSAAAASPASAGEHSCRLHASGCSRRRRPASSRDSAVMSSRHPFPAMQWEPVHRQSMTLVSWMLAAAGCIPSSAPADTSIDSSPALASAVAFRASVRCMAARARGWRTACRCMVHGTARTANQTGPTVLPRARYSQ